MSEPPKTTGKASKERKYSKDIAELKQRLTDLESRFNNLEEINRAQVMRASYSALNK